VTHYDIAESLRVRHPGKARAAAEQHIEQVRERLMRLFILQPTAGGGSWLLALGSWKCGGRVREEYLDFGSINCANRIVFKS